MVNIPTNIPFEEWVRYVFDHPVVKPEWYWGGDADSLDLDQAKLILYITQLFSRSAEVLSAFSDAQVDQGFWLLVGAPSELQILGEATLPITDRVCCIDSILVLFRDCFARRCTNHLSHIDKPGVGPLNSSCYMWWDIIPLHGDPEDASRRQIDDACLTVMQKTLEIPSVACQESALHGLGHWACYYGERCSQIIATFLQRHPDLGSEVRDYATKASRGDIL